MKPLTPFLLLAACAATFPPASVRTTVAIVGDSLRFTSVYQLPGPDAAGAIDSAKLRITGTRIPLVKRLPPGLTGTDVSKLDGPTPGEGFDGEVCVFVFRRLKVNSTCRPWGPIVRSDIAPAPPFLTVTVDTLP